MAPEEFRRLVSVAYDLIPDQFRSRMENIAVIVGEDRWKIPDQHPLGDLHLVRNLDADATRIRFT